MDNATTNDLKRIVKGTGFVLICIFLGKLIAYLYVLLVANKLGGSLYGTLNIGFAIVTFLYIVASLGLNEGLLRFVSFNIGKGDGLKARKIISFSVIICAISGVFFGALLFILSNKIAVSIFNNPSLSLILKLFAVSIPFYVLGDLFLYLLRSYKRADYEVFVREILEKTIRLVLSLIFIYLGYSLFGVSLAYLISMIIFFLVSFILLKKVFKKSLLFFKELLQKDEIKDIIYFSMPLLFTLFLAKLLGTVDVLIIGYLKESVSVGVYHIALASSEIMIILPTAIMRIFFPMITGLYGQNNFKEIRTLYIIISKWIVYFNVPLFISIALFSKQLISLMFRAEYWGAYLPLVILSFGFMVNSTSISSSHILKMIKKTKIIFFTIASSITLNIILDFILIPSYGIVGASIATAISQIMVTLIYIIFCYKYFKLQPILIKKYLKSIIFGVFVFGLIYLATKSLVVGFDIAKFLIICLIIFVSLLIYLFLLWKFGGFDSVDKEIFNSIKKKIKFWH